MTTEHQNIIKISESQLRELMYNSGISIPGAHYKPTPISPGMLKLANLLTQWGADQELEACCEVLADKCFEGQANLLRSWRRPKPPSLAEQGMEALKPPSGPVMLGTPEYRLTEFQAQILRAALNRLVELEAQQ
jgi:hypothetical protein